VCSQAAYNWALAAYFHHGKDHAETKAAVAATKAADPEAWVPKLLAGLSYPPPSMDPASLPGTKMEAVVSVLWSSWHRTWSHNNWKNCRFPNDSEGTDSVDKY
jgi:hypothetical protein